VPTVAPAEGAILERILETTYSDAHQGLTRPAFAKYEAARQRVDWAVRHQRRFALVESGDVLASAQRHELTGMLDQQPVKICGIGEVFTHPSHRHGGHAPELVERLLDDAGRNGADMVLLFVTEPTSYLSEGFEVIPMMDVELQVTESSRRGAPMTLVRGGEDRDIAAIVAMGQVRAGAFRFHLNRDIDLVKCAITKKRLLAGLAAAGARQLQFFIAEEGITAAAYIVMTIVGHTWTIEECGDRDASGARVGAILQALIAREPFEKRPVIRGWLPSGFVPPQVTIVSSTPSKEVMMMRCLRSDVRRQPLSMPDVLYWRSDIL
jgi:hypothetical protein